MCCVKVARCYRLTAACAILPTYLRIVAAGYTASIGGNAQRSTCKARREMPLLPLPAQTNRAIDSVAWLSRSQRWRLAGNGEKCGSTQTIDRKKYPLSRYRLCLDAARKRKQADGRGNRCT